MENIVKSTAVIIPGHNVKWFAVLCIESLLETSDFKRSQIFYFDDNSTDETREELESRGIKVITWDEETHEEFVNSPYSNDICVRVSEILNSAYKQINTKYIMVIDSDMVFFEDNNLNWLLEKLNRVAFAGLRRITNKNGVERRDVCQNVMCFNKPFLEAWDALGDDIEMLNEDDNIETGMTFYERLEDGGVPRFYVTEYCGENETPGFEYLMENTVHFQWVSSSMRNDNFAEEMCYTEVKDSVKEILKDTRIVKMCERYSIPEEKLKEAIENQKKSNICD